MGLRGVYRYFIQSTIIGVLFLTLYPTNAQLSYTISNYTVNDGLPQSTVYSILQDKRGFLWFSTYGGGVAQYDGVNFKTFTEEDSLKQSKVYKLLEDSKGNIWVGGREGLSMYDGFSFKNIDLEVQNELPQVRDIIEDDRGDIWIATYGYGLFKYSNGKIAQYDAPYGLASDYLYGLTKYENNTILIGTRSGISLFDGKRFTKFDDENEHKHNSIRDLLFTPSSVWYGSYGGGVCKVTENKHECIPLRGIKNTQNVMAIMEAKNGDVWVGTFGEGLYRITPDSTYNLNIKNSDLSTNNILSLFEDELGNIWVGTFLGGVCKISETAFYSFTRKDGLGDPSVENLFEMRDGSILMTLMSGGVNIFKDGEVMPYYHSDKIGGNRITSIFQDFKGYLWMTTDGDGAYKIMGSSFEKLNFINGKLPSDQIFTGLQAKDSSIWLGTYGDGIIHLVNNETKLYQKEYERGLNSNQVLDIEEDIYGNMWFATNGGGIAKFDGKNFTSFDTDVLDFVGIEKDLFGNLWFASNGGGLFQLEGDSLITFTTKDGLISNNVNLICFDNANNLWVGSEKGINKIVFELINPKTSESYLLNNDSRNMSKNLKLAINNVETYNVEDGLVGIETNQGAVLKDSQGNLWFGTINGVSKYNPKADKFNIRPPKTRFTDIKLGNEYVDWLKYSDSIVPWSKLPINLELKHNQNHLTFEFIGINFNVPHGVVYKYILEGSEKEWTQTTRPLATYTNISPGEYTFKVLARNEDGVWQQEPTIFSFTIKKPFWFEWWFIIALILIIALLIFIVVKRREREIKRRNILLERTVNERTLELKREKEKIEEINVEVEKKNEQILDSIQYAKRIQMAILPPDEIVREKLPNHSIFYEAKDIVSGDFYWLTEEKEIVYFAAVDCTGHGVPGAFMSIVGYRLLELLISGYKITEPSEILDELHMQVLETLHKQKGSAKDISDGMDIALCAWDRKTKILKYSGAHNPLYLIREGELIEYPSDSRPIGMSMMKEFKKFNQHEIKVKKGDVIYIFTDGYADQFGGENYRKYYYQTFQKLLLSIAREPMDKQKELLKEEFYNWKGNYEQIDDVLVFGVQF